MIIKQVCILVGCGPPALMRPLDVSPAGVCLPPPLKEDTLWRETPEWRPPKGTLDQAARQEVTSYTPF